MFVHRSFQEYFCALFLVGYHGPQVKTLLDRIARRLTDQVFPMLFEMARDKVEREWVLPHLNEMLEGVAQVDGNVSARIFDKIISMAHIRLKEEEGGELRATSELVGSGPDFAVYEVIYRLYASEVARESPRSFWMFYLFNDQGVVGNLNRILTTESRIQTDLDAARKTIAFIGKPVEEGGGVKPHTWRVTMTAEVATKLGLDQTVSQFVNTLRAVKTAIEKRIGDQDSIVETLFREPQPGKPRARRARR